MRTWILVSYLTKRKENKDMFIPPVFFHLYLFPSMAPLPRTTPMVIESQRIAVTIVGVDPARPFPMAWLSSESRNIYLNAEKLDLTAELRSRLTIESVSDRGAIEWTEDDDRRGGTMRFKEWQHDWHKEGTTRGEYVRMGQNMASRIDHLTRASPVQPIVVFMPYFWMHTIWTMIQEKNRILVAQPLLPIDHGRQYGDVIYLERLDTSQI